MSSIMIFSRTTNIMSISPLSTIKPKYFNPWENMYCPIAKHWKRVIFSQMTWYVPDTVSDFSCWGIYWLSSLEFYKIKSKNISGFMLFRVTDLGKNHNIEGFKAFQQYYSTICKLYTKNYLCFDSLNVCSQWLICVKNLWIDFPREDILFSDGGCWRFSDPGILRGCCCFAANFFYCLRLPLTLILGEVTKTCKVLDVMP